MTEKGVAMFHTIIFMFFAGFFALNSVPHLVKGLTKESFPSPFGSAPTVNFIVSWIMLMTAGGLIWASNMQKYRLAAFLAAAVGGLAIGLFDSIHGPFERK